MQEVILSETDLAELFAAFPPMNCWKVGLSYGSTVYFEMGDKIKERTRDGSLADTGSSLLILYGDYWQIFESMAEISRSETVSRDIAETQLNERFSGKTLEKITIGNDDKICSIHFSSKIRINIDPCDKPLSEMNDYDNSMTLFLPNGRILDYDPAKGLRLVAELDSMRHEYWKKQKKNKGKANR